MARVLVLFAHPALEKSRVHTRLVAEAPHHSGLTFHDLYEAYPRLDIDIGREQELLTTHDIVVANPMWNQPFNPDARIQKILTEAAAGDCFVSTRKIAKAKRSRLARLAGSAGREMPDRDSTLSLDGSTSPTMPISAVEITGRDAPTRPCPAT